jgi:hypothetical protein
MPSCKVLGRQFQTLPREEVAVNRILAVALGVALSIGAVNSQAHATSITWTGTGGESSSGSYAIFSNNNGPLTAWNLSISTINPGGLSITGGRLSFETGNLISSIGGIYTYAAGGYINVYGTVPSLGMPNVSGGVELLAGSFSNPLVLNSNTGSIIDSEFGAQLMNSWLRDHYGLGDNPVNLMGLMNLTMSNFQLNGNSFTADPGTNHLLVQNPEPSSILLLGSGLAGFAFWGRKRMAKGQIA